MTGTGTSISMSPTTFSSIQRRSVAENMVLRITAIHRSFEPAADRLFRNNGDGTFTDISQQAGIAAMPGRGLGVVCLDLTGDGWADFYVANDGEANQLYG